MSMVQIISFDQPRLMVRVESIVREVSPREAALSSQSKTKDTCINFTKYHEFALSALPLNLHSPLSASAFAKYGI